MEKNNQLFENGVAFLRNSEFDKALKIFSNLIDLEPTNGDYWSERGVTYFHLNKKDLSLSDMDKAVDLQPLKPYRYSSRAYIRAHYKMTKLAIADYEKAIELDPEDAVAQNNLGMLQEQLGYKKEAKKRFDIADNLSKGNTDLGIEGKEIEARNIQKELDEERKSQSLWTEIKSLSTKKGRKSFAQFISSGFKKT